MTQQTASNKRKQPQKPWTTSEVRHLREIWVEGKLSIPKIAAKLGRTRQSVYGKLSGDRRMFPRRHEIKKGVLNGDKATVRVAPGVSKHFDQLCRENEITRAILLREILEASVRNKDVMKQAIDTARRKLTEEV